MTRRIAVLAFALSALPALAQQPTQPPQRQPYSVGNPVGLPVVPGADGVFNPVSSNVRMFGSIHSAESCSYDPVRDLIVVPSRGVPQNVQANNAWVSLINHDGSVHTARWIGVHNAGPARANLDPPLVLNEPFGSHIVNGILYVADRDGGTAPGDPSVSVIRKFDMRTGIPAGEVRVTASTGFNDIEVAEDGTIYATQTGSGGPNGDPATWQVWRITPAGEASILVQGAPLRQPNGVALDPQGRVVVVNIGNDEILTFSTDGRLVATERAAQAGSDGLVIMADGTKYVSSVIHGGISRIRPGQPAELIATNIPNAASMCYDAGGNQLVVPMNPNNGLSFVPLDRPQAAAGSLQVRGAIARPLTLTKSDLAAMPRASVTTTSGGIATVYEGVWVAEVLKRAGVSLGSALRGAVLSNYVVATASDGYQVVFSLGELDPEMSGGQFLLADRANGQPLFGEHGDFRIVVPGDRRGARSLRMLVGLEVVAVKR